MYEFKINYRNGTSVIIKGNTCVDACKEAGITLYFEEIKSIEWLGEMLECTR